MSEYYLKVSEEDMMHDLFNRWRRLGFEMQGLSGIVQNAVPITEDDLSKWLAQAQLAFDTFKHLRGATGVFLANCSMLTLRDEE